MIIDDDADLLEGMRLLFEDEGWTVYTHDGLDDIMKFIRQHDADILVLDIFLPHDNGNDIALQTRHEFPHQKIILISAAGQLNRLTASSDADAYLAKPFRLERLEELARKVLTQNDDDSNDQNGNGGRQEVEMDGRPALLTVRRDL